MKTSGLMIAACLCGVAACKQGGGDVKKAAPLAVPGPVAVASAPKPAPIEVAKERGRRGARGGVDGGALRIGSKLAPAGPLPDTARFVSVAELRKHPLFAPFAELVETEDDLEESVSSDTRPHDEGDGDDDADESPDRPPSDLSITRLGLAGEAYVLAYEENCGEDLEDKRNLTQVLLERRGAELHELFRKSLCGEAHKGMSVDVVKLTALGPELLVRSWIIDPDGASEHSLRAFRPGKEGLFAVGAVSDAIDGAIRVDASFPQKGGVSEIELGVHTRDDEGKETRRVLRYGLAESGFSRLGGDAPVAPALRPAAAPPR